MKFLKKIETFNQFISFHIFAFAGWVSLGLYIHLYFVYHQESQRYENGGDWGAAYAWYLLILSVLAISIFLLTFIIFLLERAFFFKIKNKFLVENKILKILRYIGSIYGLIYLGFVLGIIIIGFFLY